MTLIAASDLSSDRPVYGILTVLIDERNEFISRTGWISVSPNGKSYKIRHGRGLSPRVGAGNIDSIVEIELLDENCAHARQWTVKGF